jgi:hypothetical protein
VEQDFYTQAFEDEVSGVLHLCHVASYFTHSAQDDCKEIKERIAGPGPQGSQEAHQPSRNSGEQVPASDAKKLKGKQNLAKQSGKSSSTASSPLPGYRGRQNRVNLRVGKLQGTPQTSLDISTPSEDTVSSDEEPVTAGHAGKGKKKDRGRGKGMSGLRPKTSSGKGTDRSGKSSALEMEEDEEDDTVNSQSVGRPVSNKRKLNDSAARASKPRKRRASSDRFASDGEEDDEDDEDIVETLITTPLPLRYKEAGKKHKPDEGSEFLPIILSSPLPSLEPNEPGGTWLCQYTGCMHRVYGADSADGAALVKDHFQWHSAETQKHIDLVMREQRPHLPIK